VLITAETSTSLRSAVRLERTARERGLGARGAEVVALAEVVRAMEGSPGV
jgi:hypothetical protein